MYALFSYAYFWSIENNCVAANGAVRFSVRGFGCALFILGGKTMNKKEKVIIQSNPIKASVAVKIILIIGVAAALIVLSAFLAGGWEGTSWLFALGTFAVFGLIALVVYLAFNGMQLILTDKRIYGRGFFGKQMSLPCDKISSVSTTILFGGIIIGTSSGYLRWYCLGEDKIKYYDIVNDILVARQDTKYSPEQKCDGKYNSKQKSDNKHAQHNQPMKEEPILSTQPNEIPSFEKHPQEFIQIIKSLSTEDLKTILDDQQDLFSDAEIEIIQAEYNKKLKETNLFDLL